MSSSSSPSTFTSTTNPNPSFAVSLATPSDAPAIAPIFFSAFHEKEYFRAMMPQTASSLAAFERSLLFAMKDSYTRVLKVTDTDTGRIVSSGQWLLPKEKEEEEKDGDDDDASASLAGAGKQPGEEEGRWADFPAHCDEELAHALFGSFVEHRRGMMGDRRHYYMELLYTAEGHKGQGAGSMILKYGCDMADRDGLEAYIDGSPRGRPLYERFGWVFTKQVKLPRFDYHYNFGIRQPQK